MDKKTFFHKVSQMRAVQREYFKTRSSAALASSKLLERQIDEEIKRAKAVMTAKARLFYELVEWSKAHSAFLARCIQTKTGLANLTPFVPIEVIGNIYDNPNLLKQSYIATNAFKQQIMVINNHRKG